MESRMNGQRAHVRIPQSCPTFWRNEQVLSLDDEPIARSDTLLGVIYIYWYKYDT